MNKKKLEPSIKKDFLIETKDVNIFFGGNHAVNGVNLKIEDSKINAIVGPNGSGKSTLFNLISKVYTPSSGKIFIENEDVTSFPDFKLASPFRKNNISRTFQETPLFPYLSIGEHLQLVLDDQNENFFHSFFSKKKVDKLKMKEALATVGLSVSLDMPVVELSYGQRKLLSFALAMVKPHRVLLIDEPVSGVNARLRDSIAKMLLVMKQQNETIVLIEHDMNFVFSVADKVAVMDSGKLIFHGRPEEARNNEKVLAAYLGE